MYRTGAGLRTGTATRIYQPTANGELYFQQGTYNADYGTETFTTRLAINSSGNVGIGTTGTNSKLYLYDPSATVVLSLQSNNSWVAGIQQPQEAIFNSPTAVLSE